MRRHIRIIHNMARSGGTVIGRCVGSMNGVLLLSEIHPSGLRIFNPALQAASWFNLITPEYANRMSADYSLIDMISEIESISTSQGQQLVIRDWCHLDYVGTPFVSNPTGQMGLVEELDKEFELVRVCITRNPIDQLESTYRTINWSGKKPPSLNTLLLAFSKYARVAKEVGFVKYEDFVENNQLKLKEICSSLGLAYDEGFKERWYTYSNITGDLDSLSRHKRDIKLPERKTPPDIIMAQILENQHYHEICETLDYYEPQYG